MIVEKKVHLAVQEIMDSDIPDKIKTLGAMHIGKYQFICSSKKGKISLIKLENYFHDGIDLYEIYCLEGKIFQDCERFGSFDSAMEKVRSLLD